MVEPNFLLASPGPLSHCQGSTGSPTACPSAPCAELTMGSREQRATAVTNPPPPAVTVLSCSQYEYLLGVKRVNVPVLELTCWHGWNPLGKIKVVKKSAQCVRGLKPIST